MKTKGVFLFALLCLALLGGAYGEPQRIDIQIGLSGDEISIYAEDIYTEEARALMLSVMDVFRTVCLAYGMREKSSRRFSVSFEKTRVSTEEPAPYTLPEPVQRVKGKTVWIDFWGMSVFSSSYIVRVKKEVDSAFKQVFGKIDTRQVLLEALEQWE